MRHDIVPILLAAAFLLPGCLSTYTTTTGGGGGVGPNQLLFVSEGGKVQQANTNTAPPKNGNCYPSSATPICQVQASCSPCQVSNDGAIPGDDGGSERYFIPASGAYTNILYQARPTPIISASCEPFADVDGPGTSESSYLVWIDPTFSFSFHHFTLSYQLTANVTSPQTVCVRLMQLQHDGSQTPFLTLYEKDGLTLSHDIIDVPVTSVPFDGSPGTFEVVLAFGRLSGSYASPQPVFVQIDSVSVYEPSNGGGGSAVTTRHYGAFELANAFGNGAAAFAGVTLISAVAVSLTLSFARGKWGR